MNTTDFKLKKIKDATLDMTIEESTAAIDVVTDNVAKIDNAPKDGIIHIWEMEEDFKVAEEEKGKFLGLSTGYTTLDNRMGGLEEGSVVLVAGETGNGKSMLALNIGLNIARRLNNVLYISLEMTKRQMIRRIKGIIPDTVNPLEDLDFGLQESFNLDYGDIEPLLRRATEEDNCKVVFLDYLQYMGRGMGEKEVAKMSQVIKRLALKYGVCFVVIVSLRKSTADPKNKRKWFDIEVEELMGTAAIGYDADTVVVASRKNLENEFDASKFFVKVLKTRNTELNFHDRIVELEWNHMLITEDFTETTRKRIEDGTPVQPKLEDGFIEAGQ